MSRDVYTSDVLISIGDALANDYDLKSLSKTFYGRGIKIVVGGYAQKLASDDDAPFIWVYSEEDDSEVNGEGVVGFTAKIVLGICPQKDVPSTVDLFEKANDLKDKTNAVQSALVGVLDTIPEGTEMRAAVEPVVTSSEAARDAAEDAVESATEAAGVGEYETMFSKMTEEITYSATVRNAVTTVATIVGEDEESAEAIAEAVDAATASATSSAALETEQAKVAAAFASFIDDPFISEVVKERGADSNGLTIYGAIRTVDIFKRNIIRVLNQNRFFIPLESVKFKNQAVAHYPLDWSEITAHFHNTETLGL